MIRLMLILALVQNASAVPRLDRIGNGGGFWVCTDEAGQPSYGQLIDFFEAESELNLKIDRAFLSTDPERIVEAKLEKIKRDMPQLYADLIPHFEFIRANWSPVAQLGSTGDMNLRTSPAPNTCRGLWRPEQAVNFTSFGKVLYRQDLWLATWIPALDRAGLVFHEAVYSWARQNFNDQTSQRARLIVGYLFSDLSTSEIEKNIRALEHEALPQDRICRLNRVSKNLMGLYSSELFVKAGLNEKILRQDLRAQCLAKMGQADSACLYAQVECGPIDNREPTLCSLSPVVGSSLYIGRGNSKFAAETALMQDCLSQSYFSMHCVNNSFRYCKADVD